MQFMHANLHRVYGDTCNCINHFGVPDGGMSLQSNWHLCAAECRLAVPATAAQPPHAGTVPHTPCEQSKSRLDTGPRGQNLTHGVNALWALQGHAGNCQITHTR